MRRTEKLNENNWQWEIISENGKEAQIIPTSSPSSEIHRRVISFYDSLFISSFKFGLTTLQIAGELLKWKERYFFPLSNWSILINSYTGKGDLEKTRIERLSQFHIILVGITIDITFLKGNLERSIKGHKDTCILWPSNSIWVYPKVIKDIKTLVHRN